MNKKGILLLLIAAIFTFSSCVSGKFRVEPKEGKATLLIGHIKMKTYGFDEGRGHNSTQIIGMGGEFSEGLVMRVKNIDLDKTYTVSARITDFDYALIFSNKLPAGSYKIVECSARTSVSAGQGTYNFQYKANSECVFQVVENSVNNLGEIVIHFDGRAATHSWNGQENIYEANSPYESRTNYFGVQNWFSEQYPESLWNESEWINVLLVGGLTANDSGE